MSSEMSTKTPTYQTNLKNVEAGTPVWNAFKEETKDAMNINKNLLLKILDDNKDTEYGKKYGFSDIHSIEDYQKKVPVITYDNIAESLERMMKGEKNVLTAYHFDHFNETSGTVGTPKVVPLTDEQSSVYLKYNNLVLYGILKENVDDKWMEGRAFCTSSGNCRKLPSGLTVGEASAKMADYIQGGMGALDNLLRTMFTTPVEGVNPPPKCDTKYIHTRFALMEKNVTGLITGFYSVAVFFLQYIADNYELLINDIEKGTIDDSIDLPEETKKTLLEKIKPMPERAKELREIFKDGSSFPFVPKIWPHFSYMIGAGGDGFSIYDKTLKENFTGTDIKNIYSGVTASEGVWSVPIGVNNLDSAIAPNAAFMEFLPVEAKDDFTKCVTLDKLEVGKTYELIITNLCGFYRYRMSDAVKVTGYMNKTPLVQFMYRVNKTINLAEEKTTEKALQITVEKTAEELGFKLYDFSVYPDSEANPNTYVFLIEPKDVVQNVSLDTLEKTVMKHLFEANPVYKDCYDDKWLGAPKCFFLQPETSLLYRDMMRYQGASLNQLKPVRVITNERQRNFFFGLIEK